MEELQQVISAVEILSHGVKGWLNFNSALFDEDELDEAIDRVELRQVLIINYINKLVEDNKHLERELDDIKFNNDGLRRN